MLTKLLYAHCNRKGLAQLAAFNFIQLGDMALSMYIIIIIMVEYSVHVLRK